MTRDNKPKGALKQALNKGSGSLDPMEQWCDRYRVKEKKNKKQSDNFYIVSYPEIEPPSTVANDESVRSVETDNVEK